MIARTTAWLCVMGIALPLAAQTTMPEEGAASTQPAPLTSARWTGVLNGTNVYVRSGPGQQAYPCTKLSAPNTVVVLGKTDGWLRVVAPKGCFSVISKNYVQLDATGKTGTVTGDNVWVRAGGDLRETNFIGVQKQLTRGDPVEVIGEAGEYYKIVPPEGAYFYISEAYVRPAGSEPTAAGPPREMEGPAPERPQLEIVPPRPTTAPGRPAQAEKVAAFKMAEKVLAEEFAKPVEQRDLKKVRSVYNAIPVTTEDPLKPYVDARLAFIRQSMRDMEDLDRIKELGKTTAEKQAEYEAMRERLQKVTPPLTPPRLPAAQGVLEPSMLYPGTGAIGKRYVLIDPQAGNPTAYVQSVAGDIDLTKYVGMNVAVYGDRTFDVGLQRFVVDPNEIRVLETGATLPSPPKPTIRVRQPALQPTVAPAPLPAEPTPQPPPPPPAPEPIAPSPATMPARPAMAPTTMRTRPAMPTPTTMRTRPAMPTATTMPARPAMPTATTMPVPATAPAPATAPTATSAPTTTTGPARGLPVVNEKAPPEAVNEEEYE
ncbi:MAG: hypothetical protein MUP47_09795 [Phycisphaerae bacterium]|nr:hypothetical protein [Phycisphaerae bacterium]